ncbi:MAG: FAD-dependent oxidoreductase [Candidatus Delongbacteria bacterium]|nr:FAD-dependent oxidoreductase [Candidatus Delongbacteria bacterium]
MCRNEVARMDDLRLSIDGHEVTVPPGTTILEAARQVDIYIPTLCSHPDLPPARDQQPAAAVYQGSHRIAAVSGQPIHPECGLCLVETGGDVDPVESCSTEVTAGMVVMTDTPALLELRQARLIPIFARHRHACLTCAQQEGCSLTQCSSNVPENERCCPQFGNCELQNVANYVGIPPATPKWYPVDVEEQIVDPLFTRDYTLCIGCTRCVRACRDLKGVAALDFLMDAAGSVQVGTTAPTLADSGCRFCTACVEVCPTGALADRSHHPGKGEAELVPCREACPAQIDIPTYLRLISAGEYRAAAAVIRERVPFPGILGRICDHPCEQVCRRTELNDAVAICELKRFAADQENRELLEQIPLKPATGKRVAVVGAGPAGLTAAFYLRQQGHAVTILEEQSEIGGMLRYGIPAFRLPREILDRELADILELGIELKTGVRLGNEFTLSQLTAEGFDALFLAVGAQLSRRLTIEGSDLPEVLWSLEFLKQVAAGSPPRLKAKTIVIGGGNTAVDVALSALRCGATEVTMICLESRAELPASPWEIDHALGAGIKLVTGRGPQRILQEGGAVTGVELRECTRVFDSQGVFAPQFSELSEVVAADQVIMAIGQDTDLSFLADDSPLASRHGLLVVNQETMATAQPRIYAGGDITTAPGSVIQAIADGRNAASTINSALGGEETIERTLYPRPAAEQYLGRAEGFAHRSRETVPQLSCNGDVWGFDEVSLGYGEEQAVREAERCLQCDLRLLLQCNSKPPANWFPFDEEHIQVTPVTEGVVSLLDEQKNILSIKGTLNIRETLQEQLSSDMPVACFEFEENKMYTQRESELIQQYLQEHGELPGGDDSDLDDLF